MNNQRTKDRRKGVPEDQLPTLNEQNLGSNRDCPICRQRMVYKNKKHAEYSEKRKDANRD